MKAKMQIGTMAKLSEANAHEQRPNETMYPKDPIKKQCTPSRPINQPEPNEGKNQIGDSDAD